MERLVGRIDVRQHQPGQSLLTKAQAEQIDTELANDYERARRQLAWTN
ncbi:MAG TPA: hypothetical protein VFX61_02035 [Micromonosporaceae bacterium]|nr:hypothetical protein [Micromonosporaceae bacterium]